MSCKIVMLERLQQENEDALNRIFRKGSPSFGAIKNIRNAVLSSKREFTLSAGELMDTASTLEGVKRLKIYGSDSDETGDSLSDSFSCLDPLNSISSGISIRPGGSCSTSSSKRPSRSNCSIR